LGTAEENAIGSSGEMLPTIRSQAFPFQITPFAPSLNIFPAMPIKKVSASPIHGYMPG